jgi:sialic acid synthase SpsE
MLGTVKYDEKPKKYARSLYVSRDIKKGESFTKENIKSIRPGDGLHPKHYDEILGKIATKNIMAGTALKEVDVDSLIKFLL